MNRLGGLFNQLQTEWDDETRQAAVEALGDYIVAPGVERFRRGAGLSHEEMEQGFNAARRGVRRMSDGIRRATEVNINLPGGYRGTVNPGLASMNVSLEPPPRRGGVRGSVKLKDGGTTIAAGFSPKKSRHSRPESPNVTGRRYPPSAFPAQSRDSTHPSRNVSRGRTGRDHGAYVEGRPPLDRARSASVRRPEASTASDFGTGNFRIESREPSRRRASAAQEDYSGHIRGRSRRRRDESTSSSNESDDRARSRHRRPAQHNDRRPASQRDVSRPGTRPYGGNYGRQETDQPYGSVLPNRDPSRAPNDNQRNDDGRRRRHHVRARSVEGQVYLPTNSARRAEVIVDTRDYSSGPSRRLSGKNAYLGNFNTEPGKEEIVVGATTAEYRQGRHGPKTFHTTQGALARKVSGKGKDPDNVEVHYTDRQRSKREERGATRLHHQYKEFAAHVNNNTGEVQDAHARERERIGTRRTGDGDNKKVTTRHDNDGRFSGTQGQIKVTHRRMERERDESGSETLRVRVTNKEKNKNSKTDRVLGWFAGR